MVKLKIYLRGKILMKIGFFLMKRKWKMTKRRTMRMMMRIQIRLSMMMTMRIRTR